MKDLLARLRAIKPQLSSQYGVKRMAVFGSRLRGEAERQSDLDLLVEFEKPYRIDLIGLIALEQELSEELGVPVDLVLAEDLKPHIGERVLKEAVYL
jgi:predicted nucleotidyltransferase